MPRSGRGRKSGKRNGRSGRIFVFQIIFLILWAEKLSEET